METGNNGQGGMNGGNPGNPGGPVNNGNMQGPGNQGRPPKKKHSGLVVALIIIAVVFAILSVASFIGRVFLAAINPFGTTTSTDEDTIDYTAPYIAELKVEGTIQSEESAFDDSGYHHEWTLKKIKELKNDSDNKGLIFFVNTPGGGVYESDELYFAIRDYQKETGRPVYSYMGSMAASGGYYISAPTDRIYANRNCWTGSIGVTMGSIYDLTGLMKKYGVKAVTIDSGKNKSMGSYTQELTDEQKDILQGLIDEAYDQFVGIVSDGRKMDEKKVRKLADGRIYTAKQAKKNGLIDEVGTFKQCSDDMKKKYELEGVPVKAITYKSNTPAFYKLFQSAGDLGKTKMETEIEVLRSLMDENGKYSIAYLSDIKK